MTPDFDVLWLREAPKHVQEEYFQTRNRVYVKHWMSRVIMENGYALRDEFDDDAAVVALSARKRILGGVRANIVRPNGDSGHRLLPLETSWSRAFRLKEMFPEHRLEMHSYAEVSKLFLSGDDSAVGGRAVTLRMLSFLLDNVPDVSVAYFGLPRSLLRTYQVLAKMRDIDYVYKELEGINPHSDANDGALLRWGVFACLLIAGVAA